MRNALRWIIAVSICAEVALTGAAHARLILAVPGPGTPLQDAIDSAENGDVVIGYQGAVFTESIVIDKPIGLIFTEVDAGCAAPTALTIVGTRGESPVLDHPRW